MNATQLNSSYLHNTLKTVSLKTVSVSVLQRMTAKKCTKIQNGRAQPMFCSLNFSFGDALMAFAVVAC